MRLQRYHQKRKFAKTPEPRGHVTRSKSKLIFVVQRHKATRLHYDFRLELDGVLKSWAVPKGPSMNPGDKRLAMMVEDHPYEYKDFAGVIPEGNYGAGIVEIWDHGTYRDLGNSSQQEAEKIFRAGLKAGHLKFVLHGRKLKGEFALVRIKGRDENAWLLIKHRDEYSTDEKYDSELLTPKSSPINKYLSNKTAVKKKSRSRVHTSRPRAVRTSGKAHPARIIGKKRARALPAETRKLSDYIRPMLAKEADAPFSDPEWIFEMKWDGYRAIAELDGDQIRLYSRNGNTFNASYPVVVDALKKMNFDAVVDGEIVVVNEDGRSDFQRLQYYRTDSVHPIEYRVFDILKFKGEDVTSFPLVKRKQLLKKLLKKSDVVKFSDHIAEKGLEFFAAAKKADLEGIIAKKANSEYHIGRRTSEWLKIKNHKTADVVVAGFTAPGGSRQHFGALILGAYHGDELVYIGHTGTGFNSKSLAELYTRLKKSVSGKSPFSQPIKTNTPATWVKPSYVAEVKFTEMTKDGSLRHPVFLRLRDDKKPKEITMSSLRPVHKESSRRKRQTVTAAVLATAEPKLKANEKVIRFDRNKVKVSNTDKIFWPDEKITKGDVIDYYKSIAKYILPFLEGRPQSLYRNPNGIKAPGFYHKDAGHHVPDYVHTREIHSESGDKYINYILCDNAPTLTYLNNLGCIELNPWHSTIQNLDKPDYVVIDIDPSRNNTFNQVIDAANVIKEIMNRVKCPCYCKTSGATGLHVFIPTGKKYSYEQLKDFAHIICMLAQEQLQEFTTLERNLKKRGDDMIYLDYLQNRHGQTISSVYSLRPKPGAPVSMPLNWNEVKHGLQPTDFNIHNALRRIAKRKDAFTEVLSSGIDLMATLKRLGA